MNLTSDEAALNRLKELGPSGIETELRSLSPDCGGSVEVMQSFLKMIGMMLDRKQDFELAQAYLALFLKVSLMENHTPSLPSSRAVLSATRTCTAQGGSHLA